MWGGVRRGQPPLQKYGEAITAFEAMQESMTSYNRQNNNGESIDIWKEPSKHETMNHTNFNHVLL